MATAPRPPRRARSGRWRGIATAGPLGCGANVPHRTVAVSRNVKQKHATSLHASLHEVQSHDAVARSGLPYTGRGFDDAQIRTSGSPGPARVVPHRTGRLVRLFVLRGPAGGAGRRSGSGGQGPARGGAVESRAARTALRIPRAAVRRALLRFVP